MAAFIPGYRLGDPSLPGSPITPAELAELKKSRLFGEDDVAAPRKARGVVEDQVPAIANAWYGFIAATPHLLAYFGNPATGNLIPSYLQAVRKRFGLWILDTCDANYDAAWLAWQDEIGRRHHRSAKNTTDAVASAAHIPMRHMLAMAMPIALAGLRGRVVPVIAFQMLCPGRMSRDLPTRLNRNTCPNPESHHLAASGPVLVKSRHMQPLQPCKRATAGSNVVFPGFPIINAQGGAACPCRIPPTLAQLYDASHFNAKPPSARVRFLATR